MKKKLQPLWTAFSMYSRIPVPKTEWTTENLSWALCCFPWVGVAIALILFLWLVCCFHYTVSPFLQGAIAAVLPILLSGGIHMDGFCDTLDALAANTSQQRRLEILKDTHAGAFSGFGAGMYMIVLFGAWASIRLDLHTILLLAYIPILSRILAAFAAMTQKNARKNGLLACFTVHADLKKARIWLCCFFVIVSIGMICISPFLGSCILIAALLTYLYYIVMSRAKFGGITGDLSGYFLSLCELFSVLSVALIQNIFIGGQI